ncbi:MAG: ribonuclease P protein component [Candidatus Cloacimonetes bacterium]|nr:ribonuclease P protein component [Candidatus Cloacimonadota bacterium]
MKSIRRYYQFKEFRENGKRFRKSFFDLIVVKKDIYRNRDFGLAVITSKKIGNAVKRNKIRRWIKEYFRKSKNCIPFNTDYLVITKPGIFEYGHENIIRDLKNAIERIRKIYL